MLYNEVSVSECALNEWVECENVYADMECNYVLVAYQEREKKNRKTEQNSTFIGEHST